MPNEIYDYNKYLTPDYIYNNKEDEEEKVDSLSNNTFKLLL